MSSESGENGSSTAETAENGDMGAAPDLQEALGVTPSGNCVRHPNCPVLSLAHNKIMSCRVCFSEEKSVGIRQRKSFAMVVQQVQQMSESSAEEENGSDDREGGKEDQERRRKVKRAHSASMQELILQKPQTMDSIMKRMGQVQNWVLRQKEKEVMSLQLQIQSLEEKLHHAEAKNQEQMQTIWALRRTCQQDMKIIKTMAVQKEREYMPQHGSPMNSSTASSPSKRSSYLSGTDSPSLASPEKSRARSNSGHLSANSTPMGSPAGKVFMSGPNTPNIEYESGSDQKTPEVMKAIVLDNPGDNDPLLDKVRQKKKALQSKFEELRAANSSSKTNQHPSKSASAHVPGRPNISPNKGGLKRSDAGYSFRANSTRSLDEGLEPPILDGAPQSGPTDIVVEAQDARAQYWNDEEYASMSADPSKIFASFRGGLLDIPKSPPAASHDNRQKERPKLQLDTDQMAALKMPRMRGVGRTLSYQSNPDDLSVDAISMDGRSMDGQSVGSEGQREIPLHKLAATLESLPLSRPLGDENPENMFDKGKSEASDADNDIKPTSSFEQPPPPPLMGGAATGPPPKQMPRKPKRTASTDGILDIVPEAHNEDEDLGASRTNLTVPANLMPTPQAPPTAVSSTMGSSSGGSSSKSSQQATRSNPSIQDDETVDTTPTFFTESGASAIMRGEREKQDEKEKFLFPVTSAQCQDKYGDTGMYTGTILVTEGLPHGRGCMSYESGRVYDGDWVSGQWNGHGKLLNPNGDTYEGEFVLDARHGKGEYRWANGDIYAGDFSYDRRNGNGKFSFHNGNVYEGEFVDGMFEGFGRYEFEEGYYEGEWRAGRYHGDGELQYANGGKYMGEFRESLAHGFGVEILPDGQKRRGVWEKGNPVEFFHRSEGDDASSRGGM